VDLDDDGIKDVISGSWPGEVFLFRGRGHGQFDVPVKLKNKTGKSINVGGGIQQNDANELLVAGDATFEEKDGKRYIVYEGERIEFKPGQQGGVTGTASSVCVADLNNDGALDLVVGNTRGNVSWVPNEGTAKSWAFGKEQQLTAGGAPISVNGRAGPCIADWDGDGKPDLLVGADDGSVRSYRNTGAIDRKTGLPVFAAGRVLVPKVPEQIYGAAAPAVPTRGVLAKISVADWNGDGRPDLLVGDRSVQKPNLPEPTAQQKAEFEKVRAQISQLEPRYQATIDKFLGPGAGKLTAAEREKTQKEFSGLSQQMQTLRAKLPPEYETHGWVWLFTRKPAK
jgi:hypothetical protein